MCKMRMIIAPHSGLLQAQPVLRMLMGSGWALPAKHGPCAAAAGEPQGANPLQPAGCARANCNYCSLQGWGVHHSS